jgi:hypothetical protein
MSSLLNGREILTESVISIVPCLVDDIGRTDRNEQLLSSPNLGESLDNLRFRSDIPAELFLSSSISVEETSPIHQYCFDLQKRDRLTWQKKGGIEVSKSIDLCGRILYRKIRAICTSYRHIDRIAPER